MFVVWVLCLHVVVLFCLYHFTVTTAFNKNTIRPVLTLQKLPTPANIAKVGALESRDQGSLRCSGTELQDFIKRPPAFSSSMLGSLQID